MLLPCAAVLIFAVRGARAEDLPTYGAGRLSDAQWQKVREQYHNVKPEVVEQWRPFILPAASPPPGVPKCLGNQKLAQLGYVDVTAAPFGADNTGKTDTTKRLQDAVNFARDFQMAAFFPAGDYLVSDTITAGVSLYFGKKKSGPADEDDAADAAIALHQNPDGFNTWFGSTADPVKRARIVLAPNSPGFADKSKPKLVVYFRNGKPNSGKGSRGDNGFAEANTVHYDQIFCGIDIKIEPGNAGAAALRMRGAEGCSIQDTTIDATHGHAGIWGVPASGGSTHKVTVIGGDIGIEMRSFPDVTKGMAVQPSPSFSQLTLRNQRQYAMTVRSRGATVIVGANISRDTPGPLLRIEPHWYGQPFDGTLNLVDAVMDFAKTDPANACIERVPAQGFKHGQGFYFNNVFIRNAATVAVVSKDQAAPGDAGDDEDAAVNKSEKTKPAALEPDDNAPDEASERLALKGSEWIHYRELAVASGRTNGLAGMHYYERVFVDGEPAGTDGLFFEDKTSGEPSADLLSRHSWGDSFPSFETAGATPVTKYAHLVKDGDWAPAIQAAVDEHEIVFFPKGDYSVRHTIQLKPDTKLIGMGPRRSQILGSDRIGARFGGGNGSEPLPMISTADAADARTVIAFLGIYQPNAVTQHGLTPVGCYPLLWRCGQASVVRMSFFGKIGQANWRFEFALANKTGKGDIKLEGLPIPFQDPKTKLHVTSQQTTANQLLLENVGGRPRLMTKCSPGGSDVEITPDAGTFDIKKIELCNATFNPQARFLITIQGVMADGEKKTTTVEVGKEIPAQRDKLFALELNWKGLSRANITAPSPFGFASIDTGTIVLDANALKGSKKLALDKRIKTYGFEHYPFGIIHHPLVLITGNGGGRWYNVWYHGDIFGQPEFRAVVVKENRSPLAFYSWHLQHISSDAEALFDHAQHVSVYGIKHEHNSCFLEVRNSDHIRIFGSGGLSNPRTGSAHFKFFDTANFLVAGLADEIHTAKSEKQIHNQSNPLVNNSPKAYDGVWDVQNGVKQSDRMENAKDVARPLLWRRGQPADR